MRTQPENTPQDEPRASRNANAPTSFSSLLTQEQKQTIEELTRAAEQPDASRFQRFRHLHGRAKADYFRQEFLWPLTAIILAVVLIVAIGMSMWSSAHRKTGLSVVSFDTVLTKAQGAKLQEQLQKAGISRDPIRVDTTYSFNGQAAAKLRIDAGTKSLDIVIAPSGLMRRLAAQGYLIDVLRYAPSSSLDAAVSYRGLHEATGQETLNGIGKGTKKRYALRADLSHQKALSSLRAPDGSSLQIGVFVQPAHPQAVRRFLVWADIR